MKIGVIGADGFIGRKLCSVLKIPNESLLRNEVIDITRQNYNYHKHGVFDILINANGNSNKYWANENPLDDFDASVTSVYKSLFDFKYKKYIYISSIDAEGTKKNRSAYGMHKQLSELIVRQHCKDCSVVRLPAVIGKESRKGIVHDIYNQNTIYLTPDSSLALMDVATVAWKLKNLIDGNELKAFEQFYPKKLITVEEIRKVLDVPIFYFESEILRHEQYYLLGYPNNYHKFKSSKYYLKKVYNEGMV